MRETAQRAAVAALVVVGIIVAALALWQLRLLISLLLLAFVVAAAIRPGVEALRRREAVHRAQARDPRRRPEAPRRDSVGGRDRTAGGGAHRSSVRDLGRDLL